MPNPKIVKPRDPQEVDAETEDRFKKIKDLLSGPVPLEEKLVSVDQLSLIDGHDLDDSFEGGTATSTGPQPT